MKVPVLLSWSSGKDCAWALHILRQSSQFEVVALVTTYNEELQRVAMHGVRMELVQAQANAAQLPLWTIPLPWPCPNEIYERELQKIVRRAHAEGIRAFAFGDLFLSDIRTYREQQLNGSGIEPIFPLWGTPAATPHLAHAMVSAGLRATLTCIDPRQLPSTFVGREFDQSLLAELPPHVDPCGEQGEFHTFCHTGPMFTHPIPVTLGETTERDSFHYIDLVANP
ncbi:ATP-binding protein [Schlesneria sp. T3-172]|uniref:Dph6-related ATP pyrophosphatase n=1 Tax=Schlesneria sphaerica TaxID=3373610 RepID=UPI0037C9F72C